MPEQYYRDWLKVAAEEACHFTLLSDHLKTLGYAYGDFPAHNGLWDMVSKTKGMCSREWLWCRELWRLED